MSRFRTRVFVLTILVLAAGTMPGRGFVPLRPSPPRRHQIWNVGGRRCHGVSDRRLEGADVLGRRKVHVAWAARSIMSADFGPGRGTQVVLVRHGMSTFNKFNIFTGWCDVPLADEGKAEALEAGKLLAAAGYRFDVAYASVLKRACISLHRLLDGCGQPYVPIKTSWRLNERHYGALQGRNKATLEENMGPIVREWRRGYGTPPPPMTDAHPHWPLISLDSRYRGLQIPTSESLSDTADRVMEYWESDILQDVRAGKRVVVVAHANTIRALVKRLDDIDEEAIKNLKIPTGEPFVYNLGSDLKPVGEANKDGFRGRFVGDLMGEKAATVEEYKRREQACIDKWESNPEQVPEECLCAGAYDVEPNGSFGDDQASLGLDRYSVGYDLPLPSHQEAQQEQDVGAPVLETMAGMPTDEQVADDAGMSENHRTIGTAGVAEAGLSDPGKLRARGAGVGSREIVRQSERNETSAIPSE